MIKVGIHAASLRMPFRKALQRIAELGVDAVEIDARYDVRPNELTQTGLRQIRKWLDDYRLKVSAVSFRTRRGYDVIDDLQPRIEATKSAMQFAYALGCSVVVNHAGRIDPADRESPAWGTLVDSLTELGKFGQHHGAWLAMTTGSESGKSMRELIDVLPVGSVLVDLDPGNLIVNGHSASDAVADLGQFIGHVRAKDAVRDLAQGRGLSVELGRGTADFPYLAGSLEQHGYRGYFTIERTEHVPSAAEIENAVQYLRSI